MGKPIIWHRQQALSKENALVATHMDMGWRQGTIGHQKRMPGNYDDHSGTLRYTFYSSKEGSE
eukprot:5670771-Ditylum_brightwellii.AAC.1